MAIRNRGIVSRRSLILTGISVCKIYRTMFCSAMFLAKVPVMSFNLDVFADDAFTISAALPPIFSFPPLGPGIPSLAAV